MKAMVLAAGLGTRLRPLTDDRPKALVEIGGHTLLEITLARLRGFGVTEAIVNVHHFADMVVDYLREHNSFGMRVEISREELLLDTGGGLKQAAWFFLSDGHDLDEPFLLHNVDVLSTIDMTRMMRFHREQEGIATVATQSRETARPLLFDSSGRLCGRVTGQDRKQEIVRASSELQERAFCGIHILSPRIFELITESGVFSMIPTYLRLAGKGEKIMAFPADQYYWRDLGTPGNIEQAEMDLVDGKLHVP